METAEMLIGKTIKEIEVDGDGIYLKTTDGIVLAYVSSDGGYSSWEIGSEAIFPLSDFLERD